MIVKLSEELRQALEQEGNGPIEVVDPSTNKVYYLIPSEHLERLKPLFQEDPLSHKSRHFCSVRQASERAGMTKKWTPTTITTRIVHRSHESPPW